MTKSDLDKMLQLHNQWLRGEGGARGNLSYADLIDVDLSGAHLSGANLRGSILYDANLSNADLSGADFSSANLRNADFSNADMSDANFSEAILSGADFSGSIGGPSYYSISWIGHGEQGRRLHAVEQNGELVFSCGCWSGSESDLRQYIKDGDADYRASRLKALDIILELHKAGK